MSYEKATDWVERAVIEVSIVLILTTLILALVAPVMGPLFRPSFVRKYAMYPDWEARVRSSMRMLYIELTLLAFIAWAVLIWSAHG